MKSGIGQNQNNSGNPTARGLHSGAIARALLIFSALMLLTVGCSSGRNFSGLNESLSVQILPDTSKQFVYSLTAPDMMRRSLVQVYRSPGEASQHRRQEPEGQRTYRQLRSNTERALEDTGFCREGFLELDYRLSRDDLWMRGECREGATPEDVERFSGVDELILP